MPYRTSLIFYIRHAIPYSTLPFPPFESLVRLCLLGIAPAYLRERCCHVLSARGSPFLRSTEQNFLLVQFTNTSTWQKYRASQWWSSRPGMAFLLNFVSSQNHLSNVLFSS